MHELVSFFFFAIDILCISTIQKKTSAKYTCQLVALMAPPPDQAINQSPIASQLSQHQLFSIALGFASGVSTYSNQHLKKKIQRDLSDSEDHYHYVHCIIRLYFKGILPGPG